MTTFKAITLKGTGDKVAKFTIPQDAAAIATIRASGTSNFIVSTLAADGSEQDLLVNTIGSYSGTDLFDVSSGEHSVAFQVQSDGPWTIVVKPVTSAQRWSGSGTLSGRGDDVVLLTSATSGLSTATITNAGSGNFIVHAYGTSGEALLVNEIGSYRGQVALPDGTMLLEITSDGAWTVHVS